MDGLGELIGKLFGLLIVWVVALGAAGACLVAAIHRHDLFLVIAAAVVILFALLLSRGIIRD